MKFLTNDAIVVGASTVIITSLSVLLYADFNRKIDAGNLKEIGSITFKREMAQRKYLSQVVWEDVDQDYPVYNNDSIRTSSDSEAVVHLHDGTDINLDENTMIMLSTLEDEININFNHGSISANRNSVEGVDIAAINIKSQDTTVSFDKSNIQLTQVQNQELDLTVSEGTATVSSGDDETVVNKNEKALIAIDKKETKVVKLSFSLKEPSPSQYYVFDSSSGDVNFSWDVSGNVKDYILQISRDRNFKKVFITRKTGNNKQQSENLEKGVYYWRISAVNVDSNQAEFSEIRKVNVLLKKSPKPIAPYQGELVNQTPAENMLTFKWNDDERANNYVLEVAQDKDFNNLIASKDTKLRSLVVENLGEGQYFWRVKSIITIGADSFVRTSNVISFKLEKGRKLNPPVLISPVNGDKIDVENIKRKGILFSWKNEPGYIGYEIDISRNEAFTDLVVSEKRSNNFYELKDYDQAGKYFWRIRGIMNNSGDKTVSPAGMFDLVVKEAIVLNTPADGSEIKISADDNNSDVSFSWNPVSSPGIYKIQLSKNSDFSDIKVNNRVSKNSSVLSLKESGEYYWRVVLFDNKGKEVLTSRAYRFNFFIEEKKIEHSFVHVISPVSGSKIYIDSKYRGLNDVKHDVKPGEKISIKIVTKDFEDYVVTVTVKEGETRQVNPVLTKKKKLERIKWTSIVSSAVISAPVYAKDRIITCSENGTITVINKSSGAIVFSKKLARRFDSKAVVYDNNAYVADVNGILYSVDIKDGKLNWKVDIGGPVLFKSGPVIANNKIYIASGYGLVSTYDFSGKKIWAKNLDEAVYNSILFFKNNIIIATDALNLYSLDSKDGDENWSIPVDDRVIGLTPVFYDDYIYLGCNSGKFYAVDYDDGNILWTFMTGGPIYSSPAIAGKSVYFTSDDGYLYSLDYKKGTLNWKFKPGGDIVGSPLVAMGNIYITDDKTLFAINLENGSVLWQNTFDTSINTPPSLADDTLVVGLADGKVVSVRSNLIETVEK